MHNILFVKIDLRFLGPAIFALLTKTKMNIIHVIRMIT